MKMNAIIKLVQTREVKDASVEIGNRGMTVSEVKGLGGKKATL